MRFRICCFAVSLTRTCFLCKRRDLSRREEGPKGGPGMREMLAPTAAIIGAGLGDSVALITDGCFQAEPMAWLSATSRPKLQWVAESR